MRSLSLIRITSVAPLVLVCAFMGAVGCENKEKVLDVETPRGEVEVTRDRDTGAVEVDATREKKVIDIDTPGADVEVKRGAGGVDVDVNNK